MPDFEDQAHVSDPAASLAPASLRPPRKRIWLTTLCLAALLVGASFAYYAKSRGYNALGPFLPSPNLTQVFEKPNLHILVMGLDQNWTETDQLYTAGARTDTLLGVNIDLANKQINVLSIPRDLWVYIPKSGYGKINEAYGDGGPLRTEATVIKNLASPPWDYYVVLKIDATKNVVDALGGVDVDVEKDMDYDDNWGHLHIHLKKGLHYLNGEQAVGYIRFRHDAEGDLGRMRRQRQVITVLSKRLRDPSIALHLPALLSIFKDNVRTDLPFAKMYDLALGLRDVKPDMVHTVQLPAVVGWIDGQSVLFAPDVEAKALVHKYMFAGYGNTFDPSNVHVRVENGSGTPGAASALAELLRQHGFNVVETGNAKNFNTKKTTIKGPDQRTAGEVAKHLPIKNPVIAIGPVDGVDIDIIVGHDYRIQ
ncbi:MAG: LCP family protein [Candidatus Eremiobacteraeota bacterium]|nr:LCP family protein [Candidatus Eremiobacteraeota bacterium]